MKKKRSVVCVGQDGAEIRIYILRSARGYVSHQCCWYEMGRRQTKSFAKLPHARLFAQQKTVALANGAPSTSPATARELPYVASRGDLPGVRRILHARIVGEAFARPVVTVQRTPPAGRKQAAYAHTWDPDGLNPLALPDTVDAALAAATRQDPALRARHARRLADRAAEAWQWLLAP